MGLLSAIFDIDKDIKNIIKIIGMITLVIGGAGAGSLLELPCNDENEE